MIFHDNSTSNIIELFFQILVNFCKYLLIKMLKMYWIEWAVLGGGGGGGGNTMYWPMALMLPCWEKSGVSAEALCALHCVNMNAAPAQKQIQYSTTGIKQSEANSEYYTNLQNDMWPWTTTPVLSRWGIFVAIAKNTLYGSKWFNFYFMPKSLGN